MKNAESAFYYIKQFGYLSLHIGGNRASVEVFRLFSMYLKDQEPSFFWRFLVTCHIYLDIGRDSDDD